MIDGHIQVGNSLSLHSLCGIHDKQCSFACSNASRNLIREIHVSRGVYQVKNIFFTVAGVFHLYRMTLDCDTSFFLKVHIVEHLPFGHLDSLCIFQKSVGKC